MTESDVDLHTILESVDISESGMILQTILWFAKSLLNTLTKYYQGTISNFGLNDVLPQLHLDGG